MQQFGVREVEKLTRENHGRKLSELDSVQGMLGDQPLPLQGIPPQASAETRYSAPS